MNKFFKEKKDHFNKKQNDRFMSLLSSSFYEKTGLIFDPTNKENPFINFKTREDHILFNTFLKKENERMDRASKQLTITTIIHAIVTLPSALMAAYIDTKISWSVWIAIVIVMCFLVYKHSKELKLVCNVGGFKFP